MNVTGGLICLNVFIGLMTALPLTGALQPSLATETIDRSVKKGQPVDLVAEKEAILVATNQQHPGSDCLPSSPMLN